MKKIQLTKGFRAIVTNADFRKYSRFKWCAQGTGQGRFYAARRVGSRIILLHREILRAPDGVLVDHKDGNTLNNARRNLRLCSDVQNSFNKRKMARPRRRDAPTGVCFTPELNKANPWMAYIQAYGKRTHLGYFRTSKEAAKARVKAEVIHHGEFSTYSSRKAA